jgi:signal transduction histidine kinase/CheY-like chemotaxis protein
VREDPPSPGGPTEDIVGDRALLVSIGMGAVFVACVVFGALRFVVHITTGVATPFWGNAAGAVAIAVLYGWCRQSRRLRSSIAVHGTALAATLALLVPAAYGMTSSKWWLALVGFSVVLMGRRREAIFWTGMTVVLIPLTALVEPYILVAHAAGEPPIERAMAGLFFILILLTLTFAFRRVAERRARELQETAESLERANRTQSRFLAHMSHDLRTPLHGVIALTDLAKTGSASPAVVEQISVAQQSARVLLGLLNNILDVTRAEAGALDLDRKPFALHTAFAELLHPFAAQAAVRGIALVATSDAGVVLERVGDKNRVVQVLLNLVGNALKFTEKGSVAINLRNVEDTPDSIEIEVADTGRGIPSEKLATVFEPFQQVSPADSQVQGGAGLGLAIVQQLARAMGGDAAVVSRVGEGTTFTIRLRLPVAEGATKPGPLDLLPLSFVPPQPKRRVSRLRVLACEDNAVNRLAVEAMLRNLGHEAVIVKDGEAAWDCLLTGKFDVLLTDVEMPGLDGVALTRRIREDERTRGRSRMAIVAATAHVGETERHRLLGAEMDGHLPKPFTLDELAIALDIAARDSRPQKAAPVMIAAEEPKVFDASVVAELLSFAGESRPLLIELADRFKADSKRVLEELRRAAERGDSRAVASLAHSLVGSAKTLGFLRTASLARAVETSTEGVVPSLSIPRRTA